KRVPEQLPDRERPAGGGVQRRQLRVLPEAAAGKIERAQPADEQAARCGERGSVRRGEHGGRPERAERDRLRARHEPPETTTGAAAEAATDGAGAEAPGSG